MGLSVLIKETWYKTRKTITSRYHVVAMAMGHA